MRSGNLLFGAVQLLFILALICIGVGLIGLHTYPQIRPLLSQWVSQAADQSLFYGSGTLALAIILIFCFGSMQKQPYLRIKMRSKKPFLIDQKVVEQTIQSYWKKSFPELTNPEAIYISGQKIEIVTRASTDEVLDETLEQIEERLGGFLRARFGYKRDFYITLRRS